jgi:hypothetical protein
MAGHISRSQVNSLLRSLLEAGVPLDALELNTSRDSLKKLTISLPFELRVRDSHLFFEVNGYAPSLGNPMFKAAIFPGSEPAVPESLGTPDWNDVIGSFKLWARAIRVELDEPDPWLLVEQGSMLLGSIPSAADYVDKFSERDLVLVQGFLGQIRDFLVAETNPTQQQLLSIEERLRYLMESAKTQDKKAWAYTTVGVVVTIASALVLSPEQGHKLFELTAQLLKAIFIRLLT